MSHCSYSFIVIFVFIYLILNLTQKLFCFLPNSPVGIEKSAGKTATFCIFCALEVAFSLTLSIASFKAAISFGSGPALSTSVTVEAGQSNFFSHSFVSGRRVSNGAPESGSTSVFKVTSIARNFFLSPTKNALLMNGNSALTFCSMGTGGMFSPPAVISSSFSLPVIRNSGFFLIFKSLYLKLLEIKSDNRKSTLNQVKLFLE